MVTSKTKKPTGHSPAAGPTVFRAIPTNAAVAVKSSKPTVPKSQRRNHKGWMQGLREELICPLIPGYIDALEISKAAGALKMKEMQHLFHTYFPWPLQDWEEPPRPLNQYDPLAPLPVPPNLTEERSIMWSKHMNSMNKRLERWVKWRVGISPRRATAIGQRFDPNDPMTLMVRQMFGQKKRVKARSGAQQFRHDQYSESGMQAAVEAEFANRPDKSVKKIPLALTQRIAKEFFAKLPKEQQNTWVAKAKREADAERARAENVFDTGSSDNSAVIATCVRNTPSLISRLSNALDINTGLKVFTMVAGPMGMYDGQVGYFDVATVKNSGGTGMSFMEWLGPQRSSDLVEAYMTYVETCVSPADRARVTTHDATVPDWSKTHKALNNTANRTASFREVGDVDNGHGDDNGRNDEEGGDSDDEDEDEASDNDSDVDTRETTTRSKGSATRIRLPAPSAAAPEPSTGVPDESRTPAAAGLREVVSAKGRPRPRPAWTTERMDVDDAESFPEDMKAAALNVLRQKRARRRIPVGSDGESEEDDTREAKRQRMGLGDITNLPAEPGMDAGRFLTLGASREPTPMDPSCNDSIPPVPDTSPAPRGGSPIMTPIHGPSPTGNTIPMHDATPFPHFSPDADLSPSYEASRDASPAHEPPVDFEPRPAHHLDDIPAQKVPTMKAMWDRLESTNGVLVEWLVDPLKEFLAADGAADMLGVVDRLWRLECQYVRGGMQAKKRATLPRGKNSDGSERLKMLGDWVAGGRTRRGRMTLEKTALQKFAKEWNGWWCSLQPAWREKCRGVYVRDGVSGGFEALTVPGANGMLSVVATLSWWRSAAVAGKAGEQWSAALAEVEWVLDKLIEAAPSKD